MINFFNHNIYIWKNVKKGQLAEKFKYRQKLEEAIYPLARKYGIKIIGGKVLFHGQG